MNPGGIGNYIRKVPELANGAIYQDEGSWSRHTTGNAFCDVAYEWLLLNDGMDITLTTTSPTTPRFSAQSNSTDDTIVNNTT
ncbi:hypothetical protein, partial [Streptomyces canarius]